MKAVSETVGMEEGAVWRSPPGPTRSASATTSTRATSTACAGRSSPRWRRDGSPRTQLAAAAGASLRRTCRPRLPRSDAPPFAELGLAAARRAVRRQGEVGGSGPILVVELEGSLSVAAGPVSHDLTSILLELGADAETVRIWESTRPAQPRSSPPTRAAGSSSSFATSTVIHGRRQPPRRSSRPDEGSVVVDVGYPARDAPRRAPAASRRSASGARA